jgi:hypothetical protein
LSKVSKLNNLLHIQYNSGYYFGWSKLWNYWLNVIVKTAYNAEFVTVANTLTFNPWLALIQLWTTGPCMRLTWLDACNIRYMHMYCIYELWLCD